MLDTTNLFSDLARSLDSSLVSETGQTLNIVEFVRQELDLGITLSPNQLLPLKVLYSLDKTTEDISILQYWKDVGKCTWTEQADETEYTTLVLESGRRSGKSLIAALVAVYEFYFMSKLKSPQLHYGVATATPISILCVATTAKQCQKNIFRTIRHVLHNSPYFKPLIKSGHVTVGIEEIAFPDKGIYIQAGHSNSAAMVGATLKCFILDEVSRFTNDSTGESNALELWSNIRISAAPFRSHAKLVAISSGWYEGDAIQTLYEQSVENKYATGFRLVSWDLNPNIGRDNPIVAGEYAETPEKAALEYEGIRPSTVDAFLNPESVENAFKGDSISNCQRYVEPSEPKKLVKIRFLSLKRRSEFDTWLHLDPAINGDAYALAYGHSEFDKKGVQTVIIDDLLAWESEYNEVVSLVNVGETIRYINDHRKLIGVTADHYNSAETIQRLNQSGIPASIVYFSNKNQLMMYSRLKSLLDEGRIIFPKGSMWTPLLLRELKQVQLIKGTKIDHPKQLRASKDLADAVASVAYHLSKRVNQDDSSFYRPLIVTPPPPYEKVSNVFNARERLFLDAAKRREFYVKELKDS